MNNNNNNNNNNNLKRKALPSEVDILNVSAKPNKVSKLSSKPNVNNGACKKEEKKEEIEKLVIGQGTYGVVSKHALTSLLSTIVVKVMPRYDKVPMSNRIVEEFNSSALREACWLRELEHPAVLQLAPFSRPTLTTDSLKLFTCNGGISLEEWILTDYATVNKRMEHFEFIAYQLLVGLQYLHGIGLIHGDIKPRNIVINPTDFRVRIIDFGNATPDPLLPSNSLGTYSYRAPEMFPTPEERASAEKSGAVQRDPNGKPKLNNLCDRWSSIHISPAADIFSLGMVLLELVVGRAGYIKTLNNPYEIQRLASEGKSDTLPIDGETYKLYFSRKSARNQLIREMLSFNAASRPRIETLLNSPIFTRARSMWTTKCPQWGQVNGVTLPAHFKNKLGSRVPMILNPNYCLQEGALLDTKCRTAIWVQLFGYCQIRQCLPLYSLAIYLFDQFYSVHTAMKMKLIKYTAYLCLLIVNDLFDYGILSLRQIYTELKHQEESDGDAISIKNEEQEQQQQEQHNNKSSPVKWATLPFLGNVYAEIVQTLNFELYFRMFDHMLLNERVTSRVHMQYTTQGVINYELVRQLCLNPTTFLCNSQLQLVDRYKVFENRGNNNDGNMMTDE